MPKLVAALAALSLSTIVDGALAQVADDLGGRWVASWTGNTSTNALSLTNNNGRLYGTYENDAKDVCSVTGNFEATSRHLAFQIVCPNWDMRMQGVAAPNGRSITGNYQAYVDATGDFTLVKQ